MFRASSVPCQASFKILNISIELTQLELCTLVMAKSSIVTYIACQGDHLFTSIVCSLSAYEWHFHPMQI